MIMVDSNPNLPSKKSKSKEILGVTSRQVITQGAKGDFISVLDKPDTDNRMANVQYVEPDGIAGAILPVLKSIREPLAEYQEKKGIAKNQNYTFLALISAVTQYIYSVILSIGNMVYNLFPIVDAFLLILRFLLDKGIDCLQAQRNERMVKLVVFFVEFVAIVLMVLAISGLILVPLSVLFGHVFHKVWHALF